jgi:hypothetical protein
MESQITEGTEDGAEILMYVARLLALQAIKISEEDMHHP